MSTEETRSNESFETRSNGSGTSGHGYGTYNDPHSVRFVNDIVSEPLINEATSLIQTNQRSTDCRSRSTGEYIL